MFQLRDYQSAAVHNVFDEWTRVQSTAVIHPTGAGKTVTAADIILKAQPKRTLFLAPKAELVTQARDKIEEYTGLKCELEMNVERASRDIFNLPPVIIGTIQTQYARNNARVFDPKDIDLLILDELHQYLAPASRKVIQHYKQNPNIKIVGLTATPKRTDEQALLQLIDSVAHVYELEDAIKDGYLSRVKQLFVPVAGLDYSHITDVAGDFKEDELQAVLEDEKIVQGMIEPICEIVWRVPKDSLKGKPVEEWGPFLKANGKPRRSIVFCVSVKQAEMFSAVLNRAVDGSSAWVCETTHKKDRARILDLFAKNDELHTVCNVGILGVGYDNPLVEVVIQARPTKSLLWYQQTIGRATRTLKGVIDGLNTVAERLAAIAKSAKTYCLVVDFVGNCGRHKLISTIDILGGKYTEALIEKATKTAQKDSVEIAVDQLILETEEAIQREEEKRKAKLERERQQWEKRKHILATAQYRVVEVDPFAKFGIKPVRDRGWDNHRELSKKQKTILTSNGINPNGHTYGQAHQLINEICKRQDEGKATYKQIEKLIAMGKSTDMTWQEAAKITRIPACSWEQAKTIGNIGYNPLLFSFKTAHELLTKVEANGWKKLPESVQPAIPPPPPKPKGIPATEPQKGMLRKFRYNVALLTKKEAQRLIIRLRLNKGPLPLTDPDHPKNWKEPKEVEVEPEPELVVQEDMF